MKNERGAALIATLFIMALLTILGTTAINTTIDELHISGNDRRSRLAFYQAESGVEYARAKIRRGFIDAPDKSFFVDNFKTSPPDFSAPAGYDFTVVPEVPGVTAGGAGTESDPYRFPVTSTGSAEGGASESVEAMFHLFFQSSYNIAAFGRTSVEFGNSSTIHGDLGSNGEIVTGRHGVVDGDVLLGPEGLFDNGGYSVTGSTTTLGEAHDPDPLGAFDNPGGELFQKFNEVVDNNNNADPVISPYVTGTVLDLDGTVTLPAGDYYFTEIVLGHNAEIIVSGEVSGEVNIYLSGPLTSGHGAKINESGVPTDFNLYCNSDWSEDAAHILDFQNHADMRGLIYAPRTKVQFRNSLNFYGALFAEELSFENSPTLYFEPAMANKISPGSSTFSSTIAFWREG